MKAASSLHTRCSLLPRQEPATNTAPLGVRGSNAYTEAQLAGEGAAGEGRGMITDSEGAQKHRQAWGRRRTYRRPLLKGPGGLDVTLEGASQVSPYPQGLSQEFLESRDWSSSPRLG